MIQRDMLGRAFASYSKKETAQFRALFLLIVALFGCLYAYFFAFEARGFGGDDYESRRWIILYAGFAIILGIGRIAYDIHLDMPYLNFTDEQFYYDGDGTDDGGYWREVTDIQETEIDDSGKVGPLGFFATLGNSLFIFAFLKLILSTTSKANKRKGWVIFYGDNQRFTIDSAEINASGEEMLAEMTIFWKRALSSLE